MDLNEVTWRKASRSTDNGGNCVEVASALNTVAIRDSKDPGGFKLLISPEEARALAEHVKNA